MVRQPTIPFQGISEQPPYVRINSFEQESTKQKRRGSSHPVSGCEHPDFLHGYTTTTCDCWYIYSTQSVKELSNPAPARHENRGNTRNGPRGCWYLLAPSTTRSCLEKRYYYHHQCPCPWHFPTRLKQHVPKRKPGSNQPLEMDGNYMVRWVYNSTTRTGWCWKFQSL